MSKEVICRRPQKDILSYIFSHFYKNKTEKWLKCLPVNGDKIEITYLPKNNGVKNAYIGMSGIVENMNKQEGYFELNCNTSILICHGYFNYIKL